MSDLRSDPQPVEVEYKPATLVPITDPNELKEATVRDYRRWSMLSGGVPSAAELELQAVRDLTIAEMYNRGRDVTRAPAAPPARRAEAVIDQWSVDRSAEDPLFTPRAGELVRPDVLYRAPTPHSRRANAWARIGRILQGASISNDLKVVASTCAHPVLALRFLRLWAAFLMRHQLEARRSRHNPFEGMSDEDAERKLNAEVENICDSSHGFLGSWRTPK